MNEFCAAEGEDKTDVLFSLLKKHLKDSNDPRWKDIYMLWRGSPDAMSVEQCLALGVSLLQSKSQYRKQYDFLRLNNVMYFNLPINLITHNPIFCLVMLNIQLSQMIFLNKYKAPSVSEPINILADLCDSFSDFPVPNCMGCRCSYADALTKTRRIICRNYRWL